jgi:hypothetical protein
MVRWIMWESLSPIAAEPKGRIQLPHGSSIGQSP